MTILLEVSIFLLVIGLGLMAYAWFNPKWQSAEAFESLVPGIAGFVMTAIGTVCGLIVFVQWFMRHWHA